MADRKEHHFCFAYKGERMRITPFEAMHFVNVQGTSTLDGYQFVRISLHRKNGRRSSTIFNVLHEYNALSGTDPITPVKWAQEPIMCFKTTQLPDDNSILLRIDADRISSSRYWSWDSVEQDTAAPVHVKACKKKGSFAGLEGLVRELNLDPSTLCMQSAYDQVAKAYFQIKGVQLKNSGSFPAKDREFLLAELKLHFDRERMFIVAPNTQKELSTAAKALTEDDTCLMDDLKFKASPSTCGPNTTVQRFFAQMLPQWSGSEIQDLSFRDVLAVFNSENEGMYRRTCIVPFMQPLIDSGAVEVTGPDVLRVHVGQVTRHFTK